MADIIKWLTDDGWLLRNSQIITEKSKHEQMVAYIHVYKTIVTLSMLSIQFAFGVSEIIAIYIYFYDLWLPVQLVPITTKVVYSNPVLFGILKLIF